MADAGTSAGSSPHGIQTSVPVRRHAPLVAEVISDSRFVAPWRPSQGKCAPELVLITGKCNAVSLFPTTSGPRRLRRSNTTVTRRKRGSGQCFSTFPRSSNAIFSRSADVIGLRVHSTSVIISSESATTSKDVWTVCATPNCLPDPFRLYTLAVRRAREALVRRVAHGALTDRNGRTLASFGEAVTHLCPSYMHMTSNRLGLSNHEESYLANVVCRALQ